MLDENSFANSLVDEGFVQTDLIETYHNNPTLLDSCQSKWHTLVQKKQKKTTTNVFCLY